MNPEKKTRREFLMFAAAGAGTLSGASWPVQQADPPKSGATATGRSSRAGNIAHRVLGRSKLEVTFLGFGILHVKDRSLFRRAVELGINYFHFAEDQNTRKLLSPDVHNLEAIQALRPDRQRLVVSYMTINRSSKAVMREDLDGFLRTSGFGHLDIWYLCCPTPEQWNDFCEVFVEARRAGKARSAAISTHRVSEDMERLTAADSPVDSVMLTYNFTAAPENQAQLARLHAAGLGIVPMKPLAGRFYEPTTNRADACLRWLAAESRVHTLPVAMESIKQLEQNIGALQRPLSEDDRHNLIADLRYVSPRFCRMCGNCDGACPNGLAVSDLVRVAMYLEGYRDAGLALHQLEAIPAPQRRMACHLCESCSVHCPNGVAVRDRVLKARELVEWTSC